MIHFNSPAALIFTPVTNLLLIEWIVSTIVEFTCNIKGPSNILSRGRCYGLQPLLTALHVRLFFSLKSCRQYIGLVCISVFVLRCIAKSCYILTKSLNRQAVFQTILEQNQNQNAGVLLTFKAGWQLVFKGGKNYVNLTSL